MNEFLLGRRRSLAALCLVAVSGSAWATQDARVEVPKDWWVNLDNDRARAISAELAAGVDPNLKAADGTPSVMYAVRKGAWSAFDVLAAAAALDVEARNRWDENVLMYAALMGETDRVGRLLDRGAQVNKLGWTALHYAAAGGHNDTVVLLLSKGAMVNAPAPDGTSPLMMAAQANSFSVARRLVDAGAHLQQSTEDGRTAVEFAEAKGHKEMADSLRQLISRQQRRQGR